MQLTVTVVLLDQDRVKVSTATALAYPMEDADSIAVIAERCASMAAFKAYKGYLALQPPAQAATSQQPPQEKQP
jgi:hypothetical protein